MKAGTNDVTIYVWTTTGLSQITTRKITVGEFTYSLAEGATGGFFDFDVTLANPTTTDAPITVDFIPENGAVVQLLGQVDASSPNHRRTRGVFAGPAPARRRTRIGGRQ